MNALHPIIVPPDAGQLINHVQLKVRSEHTDGKYLVIAVEHEPGDGIPPHVHSNEDEIAWVIDGDVEVVIGNETHQATAGTTVFFPRHVPHGYRAKGTRRLKMLWTVIPGQGFEDMLLEMNDIPPESLTPDTMAEVAGKYGIEFVATAD